jgi:hypothetical protein
MHTCTSLSFLNPAILPFRCKVTQFYGYTREGDQQGVLYDDDWQDHTYFISTQETGFELSMLKKFDVELLIGQMSYKQKATIYNITNVLRKRGVLVTVKTLTWNVSREKVFLKLSAYWMITHIQN